MATNLPKSRNRNLPPPPEQPAEVRRRPVMTPVQQAPEEPEPGRSILRPILAMLFFGGLLFTGIFFYIRGAETDEKKRENAIAYLTSLGRGIWQMKTASGVFTTESDVRQKDLDFLPQVFAKAVEKGGNPTNIRIIEGDPPPGSNSATHQIHYVFGDTVKIVLRVYYAPEEGKIIFVGSDNRFGVEREPASGDPANAAVPATALPLPNTPPLPAPAPSTPPPAIPPAPADTPPSVSPSPEKVSEPPAIPR